MDLKTIIQIREHRDSIRNELKSIDYSVYESESYGGEKEYSYKGIIGGINALLTDVSTLTGSPKKFLKISTYKERIQVVNSLQKIEDNIHYSPNYYIDGFEELKVLLRAFNVRQFSERQIEFENEITAVRQIKIQLEQELVTAKKIKRQIIENSEDLEANAKKGSDSLEELNKELIRVIAHKDSLESELESLETMKATLNSVKNRADESLNDIRDSMTESKSNEKLIKSFSNNVQSREKQLNELENKIVQYEKKLVQYEDERSGLLKEAKNLIQSAKQALNYKTAEGISASFQTQYTNSKKSWILGWWIVGAALCLIVTVLLGLWVVEAGASEISLLIGRISLLPFPIIGAIFCANQYTKQKNILEDYAYKMVVSKSIVGFSEQLRKNGSGTNEEYVHYIKTALEEIHKDPLRKRDRAKSNKSDAQYLKDTVELAERVIKLKDQV